jgi:hypothetical protein
MLMIQIAHFRVQAVQNMGLAVTSIITGIIVDKGGYLLLEMFFLGCLCGEWKVASSFQTPWHSTLNRADFFIII